MSPFVKIKVEHMVFDTVPCNMGGKMPRWEGQFMRIPVNMFNHNMHILVKDRDHPLQIIGEANVPTNMFKTNGPRDEFIELRKDGFPAGRIHLRSEFAGMGIGMGFQQPHVEVVVQP